MAELLLGQPMFPGESGVDQLVEIIKVLGTPTRVQIEAMNPNYTDFKFPKITACPWKKVFRADVGDDAIDLCTQLLEYTPVKRATMFPSMAHMFFDELRHPGTTFGAFALLLLLAVTTESPFATTPAVEPFAPPPVLPFLSELPLPPSPPSPRAPASQTR